LFAYLYMKEKKDRLDQLFLAAYKERFEEIFK